MDRERFDALTRLLGAAGSRRAALGAVVGAAVLGSGLDTDARKKKGKGKKNNRPKTCFGTKDCQFPSDGQDFEDCDFAGEALADCNGCNFRDADLGEADLSNGSFQGASFREANLRGANLEDADVSGASFRDACLVNANFFGANTDGAHFGDAILCNTILPDGTIDDSGCDKGTACCRTGEACLKDAECGGTQPFCCDNACSEFCCLDSQCPGQDTCDEGVCTIPNPTCAADPDACADGFVVCAGSGTGTCFCYVTTEGDSRCLNLNSNNTPNCLALPQCTSSDQCDPGEFCAALHTTTQTNPCCTAKICGRECPEFGARGVGSEGGVTPPQP